MTIYWLIFAFILLVGEIISPSFFLFWFSIGAVVACILSLFTANLYIQIAVFAVVSVLLLIFTKPLVKKFMASKTNVKSNVDALIGKKANVIEAINFKQSTGKVKINGEVWKAISKNEEENFEKDSEVIICAVEGVKLIVKGGN